MQLVKINKLVEDDQGKEHQVEYWVNPIDVVSVEAKVPNQVYQVVLRNGTSFLTKLHISHINKRLAELEVKHSEVANEE